MEKLPNNYIIAIFQLKNVVNEDESRKSTKVKDRKFLEGLSQDKRYLEDIIGQLSTVKVGNNATSFTTKSMVSEV